MVATGNGCRVLRHSLAAGFLLALKIKPNHIKELVKMVKNKVLSIVGIVAVAILLVGGGVIGGKMLGNNSSETSKSNPAVNSKGGDSKASSGTKPSPDKYTWFIKNYVGRNASDACDGSYDNQYGCSDTYGYAYVNIKFITDDGTKITEENVNDYVVVSQDVAPDTQLNLEFRKDESGKEYESLVSNQNVEEIALNLEKID